ncbi:MAG: phospholipid scramblase-related protein [Oligoflexia bacterium]
MSAQIRTESRFFHELKNASHILVRQRRELAELFGFETRNKYSIELESGQTIGFAAEQQKGLLGFLLRQFLGHWRRFHFFIFDDSKVPILRAKHPFRFLFKRIELYAMDFAKNETLAGAIQQRFAILSKRFDIEGPDGRVLFEVRSPFFKIWTFPVKKTELGQTREVARITKKWKGLLAEAFTDTDLFKIEFLDPTLGEQERALMTAAGLYVDLQYFERKAGN